MKFTAAAVLAFAASAMAAHNVTIVTEVVESYVTYCPSPTEITHGSSTYTVTEPTTLTITDCPCTITKPVTTSTASVCYTCPGNTQPGFTNSTVPGVPPPTGGVPTVTEPAPSSVPTAAAVKAGLSGVAGALGLAAFFL